MIAPSTLPNFPAPAPEGPLPRARSYTSGFTDELGDRQLAFDHATSTSLEVLRFKKAFGDSPEFEAALRARVEEVSHLQHPSLATIRSVERTDEEGLSLVSKHTSGRRVSELGPKARGPAFALELIRQVTPALETLQRAGEGVAHGALSADRIVVTREGRLVVVEHVLGSAIEALKLSRQQLIDLGLVVRAGSDPVRFDGRTDVIQLGFIALSLLLGRRLDPSDYPAKVPALLDEFAQGAGSPILAGKLRAWLERAMQIGPRSFASTREAHGAFGDLPDDIDLQAAASANALLEFPAEKADLKPGPAPKPHRHPTLGAKAVDHSRARESARTFDLPAPSPARGFGRLATWITAGLALLAVGEALALFVLPYARPAAETIELRSPLAGAAGTPASTVLPPATLASSQAAIGLSGIGGADHAPPKTDGVPPAPADLAPPAAAGSRFGGMTVSSPIDLEVFKDGKLVGSTAGPIAVNEGSHNIEFVNETLGFRLRQAVTVKSGQMTAVRIAVPNGRLSINAVPWAEVTIDGTPAGETPLANLSLPIGTHEIVFRHPQLGERKQTVVVKVDGLARVTQALQ